MITETFVTMLWEQLKEKDDKKYFYRQTNSLADYGHRRGWLEDKDVVAWKKAIERKSAARIIHEVLKKQLHEADEEHWHGAEKLKDLYDCHTCVNHVAQVYAKGIMEPVDGKELFGMNRELTEEEALLIIPRIFEKEKRRIPHENISACPDAVKLSVQEALQYFAKEKQAILIDVRTLHEYEEEHIPDAICIPMGEILQNPQRITMDKETPILLYCRQGYQSEIAANCLVANGYTKVFFFANNSMK